MSRAEMITHDGRTMSIRRWAAETRVPYRTLIERVRAGWDLERAFALSNTPVIAPNTRMITFQGVTRSRYAWAKVLRVPLATLLSRFHMGWSVERAFTTPVCKTRTLCSEAGVCSCPAPATVGA